MYTYSDNIMEALRQRLGLEENDTSKDALIMEMEPKDVLDMYLCWEGIIGWTDTIIEIIEEVYNVYLDTREFYENGGEEK